MLKGFWIDPIRINAGKYTRKTNIRSQDWRKKNDEHGADTAPRFPLLPTFPTKEFIRMHSKANNGFASPVLALVFLPYAFCHEETRKYA